MDWPISWLSGQLFIWMQIKQLTAWLTKYPLRVLQTNWQIKELIAGWSYRLTVLSECRLSNWPFDWITDKIPNNCVTDHLRDWLPDGLTYRLTVLMNEYPFDCLIVLFNNQITNWVTRWLTKWWTNKPTVYPNVTCCLTDKRENRKAQSQMDRPHLSLSAASVGEAVIPASSY